MKFRDRTDAGQRLAERLLHLRGANPVVLALPRGGVPVGAPIADALDAPLDLLMARKIGAPGHAELAIGAVVESERPEIVVNDDIAEMVGASQAFIAEEAARQIKEIERRRALWLRGRPSISWAGRTVIVVDDGIATGATIRAGLLSLDRAGAARRVLAVPVAPPEAAEMLRPLCDETIFLAKPKYFNSVGAFYDDFHQVEDAEVIALLDNAAARRSSG